MTCSVGAILAATAGSTSSSDTRWPSTAGGRSPCGAARRASRRPDRPAPAGPAAGVGVARRRPRPLAVRRPRSSGRRDSAPAAAVAVTTGMSKPISSRVPAGSVAELARHDFGRLAHDFPAAVAAERAADAREQQPHVVVDLGRRADGRARIADAVLLPDGDRRADALDAVDVRLLHPLEELPRVGRQRLDVAPLAFGVDGVEGERRLARPADAGDR